MPTRTKPIAAKKKAAKKKVAMTEQPKHKASKKAAYEAFDRKHKSKPNLTSVYHVRLSIPAEAELLDRANEQGIGISTLIRRLLESALFSK